MKCKKIVATILSLVLGLIFSLVWGLHVLGHMYFRFSWMDALHPNRYNFQSSTKLFYGIQSIALEENGLNQKIVLKILACAVSGSIVLAVVLTNFLHPFPSNENTEQNNQPTVDLGSIEIVSHAPTYELHHSIRSTGEHNYDLEGFLNVTVNNPTDHRITMSLTARYIVTATYSSSEHPPGSLEMVHRRTVTKSVYEQWKRPYLFSLFFRPFDAGYPIELNVTFHKVEILNVERQLIS